MPLRSISGFIYDDVVKESSTAVKGERKPREIEALASVFGKTPKCIYPKDAVSGFQPQKILDVDVQADTGSNAYRTAHGRKKYAEIGAELSPGQTIRFLLR